jgi:hypothetical protein
MSTILVRPRVFGNAGGNPPNGPSTTGNPSGGGRGNNTPKGK